MNHGARGTAGAAAGIGVLSLAVLAAPFAGGAGEAAFAAAAALLPSALIVLAARRGGRLPAAVGWTAAALAAVLAAAFALLFALRGRVADGPWVGGLPAALAVLLGGVWLLPLAFVGLAYALSFARHGVAAGDLERLRRLRAASPDAAPPAAER